jgi:predicted TIM-barrel fold metal-dependent hydrolase
LIGSEISHNPACAFSAGADNTPARPIKPAIKALKALDLPAADRRKIFAGNAERLLGKKSPSRPA